MPENKLRSVCVHSRRTDKRMERNLNIYIEFFKARSNNFVVEENEVGGRLQERVVLANQVTDAY